MSAPTTDDFSLLDYTPRLEFMIESSRNYRQASPRHFAARFNTMENTGGCSVIRIKNHVLKRRNSLWSNGSPSNKDAGGGCFDRLRGRIWDSSEELLKDVGALLDPDRPYKPSYWPSTKSTSSDDDGGGVEMKQRSSSVKEWCNMISHNHKRSPFLSELSADGSSMCPSPTDGEFWTSAYLYEDDDVFVNETTNNSRDVEATNTGGPVDPIAVSPPVMTSQSSSAGNLVNLVREMNHLVTPVEDGDSPVLRRNDIATKHKEWITDEILYVINFRDSLYKASKKNPNPAVIELYKKVRNMVVGMTRNAKRSYDKNKGMMAVEHRRIRGVKNFHQQPISYQQSASPYHPTTKRTSYGSF